MRRLLLIAILVAVALPVTAAEPNPSVRQRELAEKLLVAMNVGGNSSAMMDAMFAQIEKQVVGAAGGPGKDADDIAEAKDLFAAFRERARKLDIAGLLREAQVRIYARHFTESELADLNAFYATPTGQKSIQVMPQLIAEGMQAGIDNVSPKIEALMAEVTAEQEMKRPWRRTMIDMRTVATAIEAYQTDQEDGTYPAGDYAGLKAVLQGDHAYLTRFPEKDMWGNPYAYVVSEDRHHYRIISSGADSNFEWDSRRITPAKPGETITMRYSDRLEDDLIYADGSFIQLPTQAKPKTKKEN
ncbi:MAG TPA: DUF2059 domain-containing protein [Thermoanaerobaculia bacterium]|nr:DUF2059 domain-containing protein [Thermoanaerobaculia bacterium]